MTDAANPEEKTHTDLFHLNGTITKNAAPKSAAGLPTADHLKEAMHTQPTVHVKGAAIHTPSTEPAKNSTKMTAMASHASSPTSSVTKGKLTAQEQHVPNADPMLSAETSHQRRISASLTSTEIKNSSEADQKLEELKIQLKNGTASTEEMARTIKNLRARIFNAPHIQKELDNLKMGIGLTVFLTDPVASKYFREFLAKEFATENFDFYQSVLTYQALVNQLKKVPTTESIADPQKALIKHMEQMKVRFISEKARCEINIPSHMMKKLRSAFFDVVKDFSNLDASNPDHARIKAVCESRKTFFGPAQNEIFSLLFNDSFLRFKTSPQFGNYSKIIFG